MTRIKPNDFIFEDDHVVMKVHSKKLGEFSVLIDLDDYEKVKQYTWSVSTYWNKNSNKESSKKYYVRSSKVGLLHRFLMNNPENMLVDHKDGNEHNCRKSNLRICTYGQNSMNKQMYDNNTSGYKGVCWFPYRGVNKWKAHIQVNRKLINLGYFDTLEEAINARKEAEIKYFGEYRRDIS